MAAKNLETTTLLDARLELGSKLHPALGFRALLLGEVYADRLIGYDSCRVPGQLQIPGYMREQAFADMGDADEHIALRSHRVEGLRSQVAPSQVYFMGAWALQGDTEGMRDQRLAILAWAHEERCQVRVFEDEHPQALQSGGFTAFYNQAGLYEVIGEDPLSLHAYTDPKQLRAAEAQLAAYDALALPHDESLDLIKAI